MLTVGRTREARETDGEEKPSEVDDTQEIARSVDPATGISLLRRQVEKGRELLDHTPLVTATHTAWQNTTRDFLVKAFGSDSPNINAVLRASSDHGLYMGMGDAAYEQYLASKLVNQLKIMESCIEQLETEIDLASSVGHQPHGRVIDLQASNRVFVVHGHDHGHKEALARFLEKVGLEPIILHEKPNAGRTIIEKFSDYADVHFAVVLLTADDEGRARDDPNQLRPRARQNVILELGYFLGKLGRPRVCALYESGVDIPSDYQGVLFVPLDAQEKWRVDLVRELKAAGFEVDANKIFSAD
jgi:predicted nucleotide-binding protein